jgi:hypothetical protein
MAGISTENQGDFSWWQSHSDLELEEIQIQKNISNCRSSLESINPPFSNA